MSMFGCLTMGEDGILNLNDMPMSVMKLLGTKDMKSCNGCHRH